MSSAVTGTPLRPGTDVQLSITGMTCAACVARVEPKLHAIDRVTASRLARAALTVIHRHLAWAFGYNVAAIPLAAAGFLNPLIAGEVLPEEETA